jgi:uncharacterized coiled-coil protein SlyX
MSEETKDIVVETDPNIQSKQETVEVLDGNGNTLNSRSSPLSGIFDKLEEAKEEGRSNKEALAELSSEKPERKQQSKPAQEKKVEDEPKADAITDAKEEAPKNLRDALRKQDFFKAKAEEKKAEDKKADAEEVQESDLKVLDTDKPKTAKRIQAFLRKIDAVNSTLAETKKEADAKAAKLAELEKQLGDVKKVDPATDEAVKKQLDELAMYRRRYEIDSDPEIKTKFDTRISAADAAIEETLTRYGAEKEMFELIKAAGGWMKFAEGTKAIAVPDGEGGTKYLTSAEIADAVMARLPLAGRKAIESAMIEQIGVTRDRDRFIKEETGKASDYFKQREDSFKKQQEAQQAQFGESRKMIDSWKDKFVKESDFLKDKPVDADANAEQKAAVAEHNKYNAQLREMLEKSLTSTDVNEALELIADSIRYHDERRTSSQLRKENESLKAEIAKEKAAANKFRSASRTVPRQGSISTSAASSNSQSSRPTTIGDAFDRLERGDSVNDE